MSMTSSRPYLLRALYEWILENDCTPYIVVNAYADDVSVPQEYVRDGQIILNIAPAAVHGLHMSHDVVEFSGRFAGIPTPVYVPVAAVMGIYARENGQGMMFEVEPPSPPSPPDAGGDDDQAGEQDDKKPPHGKPAGRPALRVVK